MNEVTLPSFALWSPPPPFPHHPWYSVIPLPPNSNAAFHSPLPPCVHSYDACLEPYWTRLSEAVAIVQYFHAVPWSEILVLALFHFFWLSRKKFCFGSGLGSGQITLKITFFGLSNRIKIVTIVQKLLQQSWFFSKKFLQVCGKQKGAGAAVPNFRLERQFNFGSSAPAPQHCLPHSS